MFGGILYWIYQGCPGTTRGVMTVVITLFAGHAAFDGATLALREHERDRAGHVTMGVVVNKLSSTGASGSVRIRGDVHLKCGVAAAIARTAAPKP